MPPVTLTANTGEHAAIEFGYGAVPTLFYWFSPTCGWCELNLPNFEALAAQARGRYRLVAVADASPADLANYREKHRFNFPLYTITARQIGLYHFRGTPTSVLVSSRGIVLKVWAGAYLPTTLVDIERTLAVTLPGVSPSPQTAGR